MLDKGYITKLVAPMEKMKKMKNPKMKEKFLDGFNDGFDLGHAEARDSGTAQIGVRMERVEKMFKPGSKRFLEILEAFQGPLTEEERKKSEDYVKALRGMNNGN